MVNAYRFRLNALCKAKARDDVTASEERQLEKDIRYYSEQITFLYAKLLVHEKPKCEIRRIADTESEPSRTSVR